MRRKRRAIVNQGRVAGFQNFLGRHEDRLVWLQTRVVLQLDIVLGQRVLAVELLQGLRITRRAVIARADGIERRVFRLAEIGVHVERLYLGQRAARRLDRDRRDHHGRSILRFGTQRRQRGIGQFFVERERTLSGRGIAECRHGVGTLRFGVHGSAGGRRKDKVLLGSRRVAHWVGGLREGTKSVGRRRSWRRRERQLGAVTGLRRLDSGNRRRLWRRAKCWRVGRSLGSGKGIGRRTAFGRFHFGERRRARFFIFCNRVCNNGRRE